MEEATKFPAWILDVEKVNRGKLNQHSQEFFRKSLECYSHFYGAFISCPKTSEIGILSNHQPWVLEEYYEKSTLIPFIIANVSETFHFQFVYQTRELGLAMHDALERGAFYTAVILNRSIFEVVCTSYFTFRRIEDGFRQSTRLLQAVAKTRSKAEQQKIFGKYHEILYEIYSLIDEANTATSLDWTEHLKQFGCSIDLPEPSKRLHINDAIRDIEKVSKLPLMKVYNLMSEFAHPNFGSKTMVINTRRPHQKYMDIVVLGDNGGNAEAALNFIDQFSESLYYTLTLACSLHERSVKFLDAIFKFIPDPDNRKLH